MTDKIGTVLTRRICAAACLVIMVGIFMFSSQTADASSTTSGGIVKAVAEVLRIEESKENINVLTVIIRKAGHITEYALLGAAFCLYFFHFSLSGRLRILFSFLAATAYAATDEFHQMFVPGRAGRLYDIGIDGIGVLLGIIAVFAVLFVIRKIKKDPKAER